MTPGKIDLLLGESSETNATVLGSVEGSPKSRRAKIVCTVGPSSNSEATLRDLLRLGMDVARLNFSHGTHEEHARNIDRIRRAAKKEDRTICILQDLQGPKIRTGASKNHTPVLLKSGSTVTITPAIGSWHCQPDLAPPSKLSALESLTTGARILLSDGLIELRVRRVHGDEVDLRRRQWRPARRTQGNQSAGHRAHHPRPHGKRSRRPRIRPRSSCRRSRNLLCALGGRRARRETPHP